MHFVLFTEAKAGSTPVLRAHYDETLASALELMERAVRAHVYREYGAKTGDRCQLQYIDRLSEITPPTGYGVQLYRIASQPERIYMYASEIHTEEVKGWLWDGVRDQQVWGLAGTWDLIQYTMGETVQETVPELVLVPSGRAGVRVPEPMTVAPRRNLVDELRRSARFQRCRERADTGRLE